MERTYNFPVYGTQGGGLVREVSKNPFKYIFVEKPDCPGLDVGDFMPEEWDLIPANQEARDEVNGEQFDDSYTDPDSFEGMPDRTIHNAFKN